MDINDPLLPAGYSGDYHIVTVDTFSAQVAFAATKTEVV
jgi:hypothetical protein